jgi:HEAT repeat protein
LALTLRKLLLLDWSVFRAERDVVTRRKAEGIETTPLKKPGCPDDEQMADLNEQLMRADWQARLKATRMLAKNHHPCTAESLVQLLHDENLSVRWAAADGLKHLRREAIRPLLEELTRGYQSASLREASHHVLHDLYLRGRLNSLEIEVYRSLERPAAGLQVAKIANQALLAHQGHG